MTGLVVHQCPKCELRFSFRTELEYHLEIDHPAAVRDRAEDVDDGRASDPRPAAAPPVGELVASVRRDSSASKARVVGLVCAIALVVIVAYAAVVAFSVSTAVIVTAVLLALAATYARRARGRARVPRG